MILRLFLLSLISSQLIAGNEHGNGGDEIAQEFVSMGNELVELLQAEKEPIAGVDPEKLLLAIEGTQVNSTDKILYDKDGKRVSALNFPQSTPPQILIHRPAWLQLTSERFRKVFLVFHEYLGIMGRDDSRYQISSRLDHGKVCSRSPRMRIYLEWLLKKDCYRIFRENLRFVTSLSGLTGAEADYNYMNNRVYKMEPLKEIRTGDFLHLSSIKVIELAIDFKNLVAGQFSGLNGATSLVLMINSHDFNMGPGVFTDLPANISLSLDKYYGKGGGLRSGCIHKNALNNSKIGKIRIGKGLDFSACDLTGLFGYSYLLDISIFDYPGWLKHSLFNFDKLSAFRRYVGINGTLGGVFFEQHGFSCRTKGSHLICSK